MKIILADRSPLFRLGLGLALEQAGIIVDTFEVNSIESMTARLNKTSGSVVVIVDALLPGLQSLSQLKVAAGNADVRFLIMTNNLDIVVSRWAVLNGFHGVIAKTSGMEEFGNAIRNVLEGQIWRYDETADPDQLSGQQTRIGYALRRLSEQENNVLSLVRCGLRNKQIAHQMSLTEHTIKSHMSNILRKLEIENRTQLVIAVQKIDLSQARLLTA